MRSYRRPKLVARSRTSARLERVIPIDSLRSPSGDPARDVRSLQRLAADLAHRIVRMGAARTNGSNAEEPLGWLPNFDPQLGAALGLAAALVRDPEALATLLEAAGAEAVTQLDRILRRRLGARVSAEIAAEGVGRTSAGAAA